MRLQQLIDILLGRQVALRTMANKSRFPEQYAGQLSQKDYTPAQFEAKRLRELRERRDRFLREKELVEEIEAEKCE